MVCQGWQGKVRRVRVGSGRSSLVEAGKLRRVKARCVLLRYVLASYVMVWLAGLVKFRCVA